MIGIHLGPRAGKASIATRIRLADSQKVVAIAQMSDGSVWSGQRRCDRHIGGLRGGIVMTRPLINVPARAKRGQVIEIKTLISHVMETGFRPSSIGVLLPRDIITQFVCSYDGEEIFRADLFPAISANPFIAFHTVATQSGTLDLHLDGRQRLCGHRAGLDHGRMRPDRMRCRDPPPWLHHCGDRHRGACGRRRDPLSERRSGYDMMSRDTQAMQDDDTANPAMLWVLEGEALWNAKAANGKSCADCHGDAQASMKGVAARYPAFDTTRGQPVDLEQRINICRGERQNATPLPFESRELLALTAFIARQSRGMPIESKRSAHAAGHRRAAVRCSKAGRASSICPARSVTTTTGARSSPAA